MSRTTSGPRVTIEYGVHAASSSTRQARVRRNFPRQAGTDRSRCRAPPRPVPRRARELTPKHVGDVRLHADRPPVPIVRRAVGTLLEVTDVTERAAVHAAHVRVDRPPERHAAHLGQRRLARLDSVLGTAHLSRWTYVGGRASSRPEGRRPAGASLLWSVVGRPLRLQVVDVERSLLWFWQATFDARLHPRHQDAVAELLPTLLRVVDRHGSSSRHRTGQPRGRSGHPADRRQDAPRRDSLRTAPAYRPESDARFRTPSRSPLALTLIEQPYCRGASSLSGARMTRIGRE